MLQRDVRDQDAYFRWAVDNDQGSCCHDVSYHLVGNTLFFVGDFDLGGGFVATREFNRWFYGLDLWNFEAPVEVGGPAETARVVDQVQLPVLLAP